MPLSYAHVGIPDADVPIAVEPLFQHALETYAGETNKTGSVWAEFTDDDLAFRPHPRASTVGEIMTHQLLSERRFFGEFLSAPEPPASEVLPSPFSAYSATARLVALARPRLGYLATQAAPWWTTTVPFFDVARTRAWIYWRRVLHSAHHRTQLTVYLRLMNRAVPATYGPTADVQWKGADPTHTVAAAERKGGGDGGR
jgi:uncharacterized damage-inducible protein DinB